MKIKDILKIINEELTKDQLPSLVIKYLNQWINFKNGNYEIVEIPTSIISSKSKVKKFFETGYGILGYKDNTWSFLINKYNDSNYSLILSDEYIIDNELERLRKSRLDSNNLMIFDIGGIGSGKGAKGQSTAIYKSKYSTVVKYDTIFNFIGNITPYTFYGIK